MSADLTSQNKTAAGLPLSLRPCFQEYDLDQLDPAQHAELIIERTLAYGDRRELQWLFATYGRARLAEWVQRLGGRRLPWRRFNLWSVLLDLPPTPRRCDMALLEPVHWKPRFSG